MVFRLRSIQGFGLPAPCRENIPSGTWKWVRRAWETPAGWVEDNVPEDQALVFDTDKGLVVLLGCGHAGIINTLDYARTIVRPARIHAVVGGSSHLFAASDETLDWTAKKLAGFGFWTIFSQAIALGIEPVFRFRSALGLDRGHAVVAAVGSYFDLREGINPRTIAR